MNKILRTILLLVLTLGISVAAHAQGNVLVRRAPTVPAACNPNSTTASPLVWKTSTTTDSCGSTKGLCECTATNTWTYRAAGITGPAANRFAVFNGSSLLTPLAAATNGQLLIGSTGAIPALGTLTATANETSITNGAATITIGLASGINAAKIGGGGVSTAEFDFLGTVTSDVQTQLNALAPTASPAFTGTPSGPSWANTGTGGLGFTSFLSQSSTPTAPASGFGFFADSTGRFTWRRASDGFTRTFDVTATANRVYTLLDEDMTFVGLTNTQELTNKTLNAAVGKGTWTASGTWTLPAFTLGGAVSGGGNQVNNVIIGATTPLAGSFTTLTSTGLATLGPSGNTTWLSLAGNMTFSGTSTDRTIAGAANVPLIFTTNGTEFARGVGGLFTAPALAVGVQSLSGAGAANVTTYTTAFTSTGAGNALTLADGTNGQIKVIAHVVDGGTGVLTPTTKTGFSTVTFTNAGDSVTLQYFTTVGWIVIGSYLATIAP